MKSLEQKTGLLKLKAGLHLFFFCSGTTAQSASISISAKPVSSLAWRPKATRLTTRWTSTAPPRARPTTSRSSEKWFETRCAGKTTSGRSRRSSATFRWTRCWKEKTSWPLRSCRPTCRWSRETAPRTPRLGPFQRGKFSTLGLS